MFDIFSGDHHVRRTDLCLQEQRWPVLLRHWIFTRERGKTLHGQFCVRYVLVGIWVFKILLLYFLFDKILLLQEYNNNKCAHLFRFWLWLVIKADWILIMKTDVCVCKFYTVVCVLFEQLILASVLNAFYDSISHILRKNVEKRALLDNMDAIFLAADEICDGGWVC